MLHKFEASPPVHGMPGFTTMTMSSSMSTSSSNASHSFSQSTSTLTPGGLSRTTGLSSSFHDIPSISFPTPPAQQLGFDDAPAHFYRSFNAGRPVAVTSNIAQIGTDEQETDDIGDISLATPAQHRIRSGFNDVPAHFYRSFNVKKPIPIRNSASASDISTDGKEKQQKSLLSRIFGEKVEKNKDKKEKKNLSSKKEKKSKNPNSKELIVTDAKNMAPLPQIQVEDVSPYLFNPSDIDENFIINVRKTGVLHGTENDIVPTYITKSSGRRGNVLLINNIRFERNKYRAGAEVDHENITKLFSQMGFSITDYKNQNRKGMEYVIKEYCEDPSLKSADINVTIVMSHGNDDYIETIDKDEVAIDWIVNQFSTSSCSNLAHKPKIFIFQCCRGGESDNVQTDSTPFLAPRDKADMLLAYATVPGYVSHRDSQLGTWYIQAICKVFMEHAHNMDVENLLKIVDDSLEKTYTKRRQTSSYENRGFKRCFLNPIK